MTDAPKNREELRDMIADAMAYSPHWPYEYGDQADVVLAALDAAGVDMVPKALTDTMYDLSPYVGSYAEAQIDWSAMLSASPFKVTP